MTVNRRNPMLVALAMLFVLASILAFAGLANAEEPPRYDADDYSVAAFALEEFGVGEGWGNCVDVQCQYIGSIDPLTLTQDQEYVIEVEGSGGWYVSVVFIGNEPVEDGGQIYQVNTYDNLGSVKDDELQIIVYDDGTWSLAGRGQDPIFTMILAEDE
ncbi:MAG: hypothetical protein GYB66_13945 [Chloroflexi bacterium]|nr:hypothetical protein [Chloroflexota bacterium]